MNFERDHLTERLFGKELENSGRTPAKAYLQKIAANLKAQQGADLDKERSGQGERMGLRPVLAAPVGANSRPLPPEFRSWVLTYCFYSLIRRRLRIILQNLE